jgi:MFS family permease
MIRLFKVFAATFFISVNFGALLYVNSSYLATYFPGWAVSALFLLGAAGSIALFLVAPKLLNLFGKKWLLFATLLCLGGATLGLALGLTALAIGTSFVAYSSILFLSYYCLDIFLEEDSDDTKTGEIRGTYFTIMNAGIALGPLLLSILPTAGEHYRSIYWLGFLLLGIPLMIALWILVSRKHAHKVLERPWHLLPFRQWWRRRNVRATTLAKLVLEVFFAVMVIYTPLYAHTVVGFSWSELSVIFAIALTPFVFLEWPAGELADRYWGEKEMMTAGFFLTGTALLAIPFLPQSVVLWTLVLFVSRVGAALIEIMTETYFFKKIGPEDTGLLSIFRLARPAGIIIGSLLGVLTLTILPIAQLFFVLAIVVFFGLKESLFIEDTL